MLLSKPWKVMISNIDIWNGKTDSKQLPEQLQYFAG